MHGQDQFIEDVYGREVVMARVGHLIRRKQQEIERITRILRAAASFEGVAAPVSGKILKCGAACKRDPVMGVIGV